MLMSQWEPIVSNALGSAAAGVVSRSLTHPLDTVKARLQFRSDVYKGPLDVLLRTYSLEGIRGLYRGFRCVWRVLRSVCGKDATNHFISQICGTRLVG